MGYNGGSVDSLYNVTVISMTFRHFLAGEVLFLSVNHSDSLAELWVTHGMNLAGKVGICTDYQTCCSERTPNSITTPTVRFWEESYTSY